jgi:hypothetical protein
VQCLNITLISLTEDTANLIIHMLSVDPKWVHPLALDIPSEIPNTGGVCVTLIEANHCIFTFCVFFLFLLIVLRRPWIMSVLL